jgi:hypothetical protein
MGTMRDDCGGDGSDGKPAFAVGEPSPGGTVLQFPDRMMLPLQGQTQRRQQERWLLLALAALVVLLIWWE